MLFSDAPGLQITLSVGKRLPADMHAICFATNPAHPLIVADLSSDVSAVFRRIAAKAHKSRRLVEYMDRRRGSRK